MIVDNTLFLKKILDNDGIKHVTALNCEEAMKTLTTYMNNPCGCLIRGFKLVLIGPQTNEYDGTELAKAILLYINSLPENDEARRRTRVAVLAKYIDRSVKSNSTELSSEVVASLVNKYY